MVLSESLENYLKSILILKQRAGTVRSIDLVRYMGFSKPSVCTAVKRLCEQGYLIKAQDGFLALTASGKAEAEAIVERHCYFEQKLIDAGVPPSQAHLDAGRMEHAISAESFQALKKRGTIQGAAATAPPLSPSSSPA